MFDKNVFYHTCGAYACNVYTMFVLFFQTLSSGIIDIEGAIKLRICIYFTRVAVNFLSKKCRIYFIPLALFLIKTAVRAVCV